MDKQTRNNSFALQPASWRDLREICKLENECFGADAYSFLDIVGLLVLPGYTRIKAVCDGHIAGFIVGEKDLEQKTSWVTTLGVRPVFQRMGIGNELLKACELRMGLTRVKLCTRRSNIAAINLYIKTGYKQAAIWARYYYDGEDAMVMEKLLTLSSSRDKLKIE